MSAGIYDICIAPGLLDRVAEIVLERAPAHRYAVISDSTVSPLYAGRVAGRLDAGGRPALVSTFPAGEEHKTRQTWADLTDQLLEARFGRDSTIIALGGGVVLDVAGFVAATYMRGIPVVHVPTTLLAMIDASIGGKTGVDTLKGKNLVGAFHQPAAVIVDPDVLATLPVEELRSGMAEALKHGAIGDAAYFDFTSKAAGAIITAGPEARDVAALYYVIEKSIRLKVGVVAMDERELGARKALNFGHTIGHAIEALSGYTIRHGEAVGIGMLLEATASERAGVTEPGTAARISDALKSAGLPTRRPSGPSASSIIEAMRSDKKNRAGVTEFSVPARIGTMAAQDSGYTTLLPDSLLTEVLG
ncbi:MAG: 3-dehydroquinate synthase [Gemmatimonadaceae bacterium]